MVSSLFALTNMDNNCHKVFLLRVTLYTHYKGCWISDVAETFTY